MVECLRVARLLQSYLDGVLDEVTARHVAEHLEDCRRCGLEAETYQAIKTALARQEQTPAAAITRLQEFAETLVRRGDPQSEGE
jgi:anti-sigma factor RsiW